MKAFENYPVIYKYKGKEYYAGMIERDEQPGFYNWYDANSGAEGLCCTRRECREQIKGCFKEAIRLGATLSEV